LTAVTNRRRRFAMARHGSLFKIYLVKKGQGPRLYVGHFIFSATDTVIRSNLDELTTAVLSWPYVESTLPNDNSSNTVPLRLEETAAGSNFAAFISPREFARVLLGASTIYLALPLVCAHWAIVRGWAEPHYLCSYGLMPPGVLVVYTPRDQHELSICYSLFLAAYTAASNLSNGTKRQHAGNVN
jgi:hypothetical protein